MSWYIEGNTCYIGRDYEYHRWCTTTNACKIHYFMSREDAEWTLRCLGHLVGKLELRINRV